MTPVIRTFTGREVNPLDLQPEDIDIRDIAHALACCNRFAGHLSEPVSVAQHSIYVSDLLAELSIEYRLQALLHDASEAYLGDVTKWVKESDCMAGYRDAEARAQATIYTRFHVPVEEHERLEWADRLMVRWEGERGFGSPLGSGRYAAVTPEEGALIGNWGFWPWHVAEYMFLSTFERLSQ